MAPVNQRQDAAAFERRDYADRSVLVADFGPGTAPTVEVIDDAAVVVLERDGEQRQRELDLPEGETTATANNGVVTVEVER